MTEAERTPEAARPTGTSRRGKVLRLIAGLAVLSGLAYVAYDRVLDSHYEHTDNAYVQANVVQITPQVAGTVLAIQADDTDMVKAGQLLVKLDAADAQVALDQAEAQLAQTVREVRTLFANNAGLRSQIQLRMAEVTRAENEVRRAQEDVERRRPLLAVRAIGKEEFDHTQSQLSSVQSALAASRSALAVAQDQLQSNQSLTEGTSIQQHPNVVRAAARVRETYLALKRVALVAPVDGYVAKRSVQLGQRVQAGAPLMTVVSLDQPWVDANFKESQLQHLRIGQKAELKADVYGKAVVYHGKVVGLGAGTGAAFSLLPAQNATGNWIKIVQRVPVRVALLPDEVKTHPLRVGLSMEVQVDVRDQSGPMLAMAPRAQALAQTTVFDDVRNDAEQRVAHIISSNLGGQLARVTMTPHKGA
jgi:membrane fusion protein (multidrug efflux system)